MDEELETKKKIFLTEVVMVMNYNFTINETCLKEDDCIICCESMKNTPVIITPCNHTYHRTCLLACITEHDFVDKCIECDTDFKFINKKEALKATVYVVEKEEPNNLLDQAEVLISELEEIKFDFDGI